MRATLPARTLRASKAHTKTGFSLVELVIVVVIIGVIAAIAVPRFTRGAAGAGEAALRNDLSAIRTAIDAYAGEHGGDFPASKQDGLGNGPNSPPAFINQLTKPSSNAGACSSVADATHRFGPYLHKFPPVPVGPNKGNSDVVIDATNSPPLVTGGTQGWVFNPVTGQIIANSDAPNEAGTRTWDEY